MMFPALIEPPCSTRARVLRNRALFFTRDEGPERRNAVAIDPATMLGAMWYLKEISLVLNRILTSSA